MESSKLEQTVLTYQYDYNVKLAQENKKKFEDFKERIREFKGIKTLEEAKELASKILPVANEINMFKVGEAKCVVINRKDNFRICLESLTEFIAYDFV